MSRPNNIVYNKLLSIDDALNLKQPEIRSLYREYANPGLASMLGMLNFDKKFVRAEGACVWDDEGREYVDFLGGYGALNFGHNHPRFNEAVARVSQLPNLLQASLGVMYAALAHNIAQITPGELKRSFFGNSGAEAVEGALKLAKAATGRGGIIYCENSFHGKTMGALSVTGRSKYQNPFRPLVPDCEAIPFGDAAALEEKLKTGDKAAFIVEPIQGEGGIRVPPRGFFKQARRLCSQYQTLLIIDEIQTGFGRTGENFACQYEEVVPDVLCLGKSLGGGVAPISAFITTEAIWDKAFGGFERCMLHTSTFGGNARAAAAGITAVELLVGEDLAAQAARKGEYLIQGLCRLQEKYPAFIKEVRGRGLLVGVEFNQLTHGWVDRITGGKLNKIAEEYLAALVAAELMNRYQIITAYTLNNPNVIRFEPPLVVSTEQIDRLLTALEEIFKKNRNIWGLVVATGKNLVSSLRPGK